MPRRFRHKQTKMKRITAEPIDGEEIQTKRKHDAIESIEGEEKQVKIDKEETAAIKLCELKREVSIPTQHKASNHSTASNKSIDSFVGCNLGFFNHYTNKYDAYNVLRQIGSGAYGNVFEVQSTKSKKIYAMKRVNLRLGLLAENSETELFLCEMITLQTLKHPGIIKLNAMYITDMYGILIFDYVPHTLAGYLYKRKHTIPFNEVLSKFQDIVDAVSYIHSRGYFHRDIKPGNILIDDNGKIYLADFGQCGKYVKGRCNSVPVVTLWYRCPELLYGEENYDQKIDIWSLGCILIEMINGTCPFMGSSEFEQILFVTQLLGTQRVPTSGARDISIARTYEKEMFIRDEKDTKPLLPSFPIGFRIKMRENTPPGMLKAIQWMLKFDPSKRPTATTLVRYLDALTI